MTAHKAIVITAGETTGQAFREFFDQRTDGWKIATMTFLEKDLEKGDFTPFDFKPRDLAAPSNNHLWQAMVESVPRVFLLIHDREHARAYFEARRWPDGVRCPACDSGKRIGTRKGGFYRCNACLLDFTVRTGTTLERSKVPLNKWLHAMYLVATADGGISSVRLHTQLKVTQKTACFMMQRLREAYGIGSIKMTKCIEDLLDAAADRVLAYCPKRKGEWVRRIAETHGDQKPSA